MSRFVYTFFLLGIQAQVLTINWYFQQLAEHACVQRHTEESRLISNALKFLCSAGNSSAEAVQADWQFVIDDIDSNIDPKERGQVHSFIWEMTQAHYTLIVPSVMKMRKYQVAFRMFDNYVTTAADPNATVMVQGRRLNAHDISKKLVGNILDAIGKFERNLADETLQFFRLILDGFNDREQFPPLQAGPDGSSGEASQPSRD